MFHRSDLMHMQANITMATREIDIQRTNILIEGFPCGKLEIRKSNIDIFGRDGFSWQSHFAFSS